MSDEAQKMAEMLTGTGDQSAKQKDAFKIGFMHTAVLFLLREYTKEHGDQLFKQASTVFKARYLMAIKEELEQRAKVLQSPMGQMFGSFLGDGKPIDIEQSLKDNLMMMEQVIAEANYFIAMDDTKLANIEKACK
jgi:hypothetical protein